MHNRKDTPTTNVTFWEIHNVHTAHLKIEYVHAHLFDDQRMVATSSSYSYASSTIHT